MPIVPLFGRDTGRQLAASMAANMSEERAAALGLQQAAQAMRRQKIDNIINTILTKREQRRQMREAKKAEPSWFGQYATPLLGEVAGSFASKFGGGLGERAGASLFGDDEGINPLSDVAEEAGSEVLSKGGGTGLISSLMSAASGFPGVPGLSI
jgi:hypothetical protein